MAPQGTCSSFSFRLSLRSFAGAAILALLSGCTTAVAAQPTREVLGVAHTAGKYNFTDKDYLNEGADDLLELGTGVIKVWFGPNADEYYPFNSDWGIGLDDLVKVAQAPYYRALFDKPFSTFILVLTRSDKVSYFWDGMTREEIGAERKELYDLTRHLLTTYAGTGKTFVLQNWEGDHLLRSGLTDEEVPDRARIRGMIDWWNARQDGVDRARREVRARGVTVVHAAEVNHLRRAMAGAVTATNNVIPFTHTDLYSYSSWDIEFDRARLTQALDYLEAKAPDSRLYGKRNLYLGEFGAAKDHLGDGAEKTELVRELADTALGWGVRYAIYWQIFCNEPLHEFTGRPANGDLRGFWLIRPDGTRSPSWDDFAAQYDTAVHRAAFRSRSGNYLLAAGGGGGAVEALQRRLGPWGMFTVRDLNGGALQDGDAVHLQAHNGMFLGEEGDGTIAADRREAGPSEAFVVRKVQKGKAELRNGDPVVLEAPSGRFLAPEGRGEVRALRREIGAPETFRLEVGR